MMNDQTRYIDDEARRILNQAAEAWGEGGCDFAATDLMSFGETFNDALESASMGCPRELFPDDLGADYYIPVYNLLTARVYQLLFAPTLTED